LLGQLLDRRFAQVEERLEREVLDHAAPDAQTLRRRSFQVRTQHGCTSIVTMTQETTSLSQV